MDDMKDFPLSTRRRCRHAQSVYRVYANQIAFLIEQFGSYKVEKGQFIFRDQSIAGRYSALAAAAKRVAEVETEGQQLTRLQTEGWERFVVGHDKLAAPGRGEAGICRAELDNIGDTDRARAWLWPNWRLAKHNHEHS